MMVSKPLLPPAGRTKWQCGPGALAPRSMLATLPRSAGCVSAKAVPAPNDRTRQAIPALDAAITLLRMSASLVAWFGYLIYTRAALDDGSPVRVVGSLPAVVVGERVADRAQRVVGLECDVVGDAADRADQDEQLGPGVRALGRWDAVGHGGLHPAEAPAGARISPSGAAVFQGPVTGIHHASPERGAPDLALPLVRGRFTCVGDTGIEP